MKISQILQKRGGVSRLLSKKVKLILLISTLALLALSYLSTSCSEAAFKAIDEPTATTIPRVAAPEFSIESGTEFKSSILVNIYSLTKGAVLQYSYDNIAWVTGTILLISETKTVYAKATKVGMIDSDVVSAIYICTSPATTTSINQDGSTTLNPSSTTTTSSVSSTSVTNTTIVGDTTTTTDTYVSTSTTNISTSTSTVNTTTSSVSSTSSTNAPTSTTTTTIAPTTSSSTTTTVAPTTTTTTIAPTTSTSTTTTITTSSSTFIPTSTTTTTIAPTTSSSIITTTTTTINQTNYIALAKFAEPYTEQPCIVNMIFGLKDYNGNIIPGIYDTSRYNLLENGAPLAYAEAFYRVKERTLFDVELKTVIMIDISLSVGSTNIEKLKNSVKSIINNKSDNQSIAIYTFSGAVTMVKDFSLNKTELITAVDGIALGASSTNLYGAIYDGLDRFTNTISAKLVTNTFMIVMTDGQDTSAVRTLDEVLIKRGDRSVITVGIGSDVDPDVLSQIGNFGSFMAADFDSLQTHIDDARALITETYANVCWMTYYSPKRAGSHTIEISIKDNTNTGATSKISGIFSASSPQFYDVFPAIYVNDSYVVQNGISEVVFADSDISKTLQINSYFGANEPEYTFELLVPDAYSISEIIPVLKKSYSLTRVNGGNATITIRDTANNYSKTLNITGKGYVSVDFNSMGGSAVESQRIFQGLKTNAPTPPTRAGYSLAGWYKESGCINQWNFTVDTVGGDTVLYAKWSANQYTITFNKQSGTGGTVSVTATYDTAMPAATAPTRTGYIFGGYWDATIGGTQYYTSDMTSASSWDKTINATLYARWVGNTYIITLDKQSGSGGTNSVTATYDLDMPEATEPTRTGYTFAGYWDATSGGTQYYTETMASARTWDKTVNTTLYARWTANTCTATFDKQSGTGGTVSVIVTYDTAMPTATAPTRTGYDFAGYWDATSDGTQYYTSAMASSRTWNKAVNTTLYARWTGKTYIVTFNKNNGTGGTNNVVATYGSDMLIATAPTRTGYTFAGYWDATSGGTQYYTETMASARTWNKIANTTLYARWTVNQYTVTLDKQSGTGGTDSVTATYSSAMPTATAPVRTEYTFTGYWDATSGGTQYYTSAMASARTWDKTTNATLYARWTINIYSITYNLDGGVNHGSNPSSYNIYTPDIILQTPTKIGYTFEGWFDNSGFTGTEITTIPQGSTGNKEY